MTAWEQLTPHRVVAELDRFIVGQEQAKRKVAIALRNRVRRQRVPEGLREDINPKNILMIGPTGVGKTEIARRLAQLVSAPFLKVEATRFTEVGYVGRDVESMVRDLVEIAIRQVRTERMREVEDAAHEAARERLVELVAPPPATRQPRNPLESLLGMVQPAGPPESDPPRDEGYLERRRQTAVSLDLGLLEAQMVEIVVRDPHQPVLNALSGAGLEEVGHNLEEALGGLIPERLHRRRLPVAEARPILVQQEAEKRIDQDRLVADAIRHAEEDGILFIDEIDKVAVPTGTGHGGPDVSREGVQRDILPLVEGMTVTTRHGPVRTDHMLFIAAGAFHAAKPSDLMPELQGRFPVRVELKSLGAADFVRILRDPENALTRQYTALLATDGVKVRFTEDGIARLAELAAQVNARTEDIGARRLYTLLEHVLEAVSFAAPEAAQPEVTIDAAYVEAEMADLVEDVDLSRYIL